MTEGQFITIAPGTYAFIGTAGDSNAGAVETPHGLVVIDAQQTIALGEKLRSQLAAASDRPVRALLNTHYHIDHIAGNVAFTDVPIVAHEKTRRALENELGRLSAQGTVTSDALAKARMFFGGNFDSLVPAGERDWFMQRVGGTSPLTVVPPSETFADCMTIEIAGDALHVEYWGPAHCDGDLVVVLPRHGVAFLGDLLFNGRFPWFGDCDLDGWIKSLDRLLAMPLQIVIPGHGPPATLKEVADFRALLDAVRRAVDAAIRAGLSEDAAAHEIAIAEYAAMQRYREWMPFNVRAAYRYLRGV